VGVGGVVVEDVVFGCGGGDGVVIVDVDAAAVAVVVVVDVCRVDGSVVIV